MVDRIEHLEALLKREREKTEEYQLFKKLFEYAGKYEISFNFQMWGEARYTIYIEKDGIPLWDRGGRDTAKQMMQEAVNWLERVNGK